MIGYFHPAIIGDFRPALTVEKPPVLHMRAKPCITGMRARWHKYGPPAAKILLPAARKRAYSSIVRCFPALFSSIRF